MLLTTETLYFYPGKGYYIGGADNSDALLMVDLETEAWTNLTAMPMPAELAHCVILNDILYVIGGME